MRKYQQQLLALKQEYEARIQSTEHHFERDEPISQDFAEQTTELENEEVVEHLNDEAKQELELVNHALKKIELGSYGVCEECDENISEERLSALPHARLCIECASY